MKSTHRIQIFIIHLVFLISSYLKFFKKKNNNYLGSVKNNDTTELYDILFYITLVVLILFYLNFLISNSRNEKS